MTTNRTLLGKMAADLKTSGLSRVNVCLDTMRGDRYQKITGHDLLPEVLAGIDAAIDTCLTPVKLNMVVLKGINDNEIEDFLSYVRSRKDIILQIIEPMNVNGWGDHIDHVEDVIRGNANILGDLEKDIATRSTHITTRRMHHRRKYRLDAAEV